MTRKRRRVLRPFVDVLDDRILLSSVIGPATGLTPAQIVQAYSLNGLSFSAGGQTIEGNGTGQTIALIEAYHDPDLASDLHTFDQAFGLPDPTLNQIDLAKGQTNDGWAGEEALDVEWAHARAPGANIVVVEARSDSTPNLLAAVKTARKLPGVSVVSMSWGGSESRSETNYDSLFTTPAGHQGITFVAAAGDSGAAGGAQWPASSPNVLAVGGTTLDVSSAGDYLGESVWIDSSSGDSLYEPAPPYQAGTQSSGQRSIPDVDFDANPETGVSVYATSPSTGQGEWEVVGGTSLGAPAWSAIIAIADQGRVANGLGTLNGPTQTLPGLYSLPASDFHTVSTAIPIFGGGGYGGLPGGGFGGFHGGFGSRGFFARGQTIAGTTTWNVSTGLGSPNGSALIHDLVDTVAQTGSSTGDSSTRGTRTTRKHAPAQTKHAATKPKHRVKSSETNIGANSRS